MVELLNNNLIQAGAVGIALAALALVGFLMRSLHTIVTNHQTHDLEERKALRATLENGNTVTREQTRVLQGLADVVQHFHEKK